MKSEVIMRLWRRTFTLGVLCGIFASFVTHIIFCPASHIATWLGW